MNYEIKKSADGGQITLSLGGENKAELTLATADWQEIANKILLAAEFDDEQTFSEE